MRPFFYGFLAELEKLSQVSGETGGRMGPLKVQNPQLHPGTPPNMIFHGKEQPQAPMQQQQPMQQTQKSKQTALKQSKMVNK